MQKTSQRANKHIKNEREETLNIIIWFILLVFFQVYFEMLAKETNNFSHKQFSILSVFSILTV